MGAILDPTDHSAYFDEIRAIVDPDHRINATALPNSLIDTFAHLGKAEVAVLRATGMTAASLRPSDNTPGVVDTTDTTAIRKRELVYVVEALTACALLSPQIIDERVEDTGIRKEEWDIERRRREIEDEIVKILPEVLGPATEPVTEVSTISVETIRGTF